MAYLAEEISALGVKVFYVVNDSICHDRHKLGWKFPKLISSKKIFMKDLVSLRKLLLLDLKNIPHICQGLRGNGLIGFIQKALSKKKIKHWAIMELIDETLFSAPVKRIIYRLILYFRRDDLDGILAIGDKSSNWFRARGFNQKNIYPFAYFLSDSISKIKKSRKNCSVFRFIFVGQLIKRKRVDFLIRSLSKLSPRIDFELEVIGDGPLRVNLEKFANSLLPGRVRWSGSMNMEKVPQSIANADCLVLPSRHDGWGCVVSEALMVGTPVICSDGCGSSVIVRASGNGRVFKRNNLAQFSSSLFEAIKNGPIKDSKRLRLKKWATCLGARAGAKYLIKILQFSKGLNSRPLPPWNKNF